MSKLKYGFKAQCEKQALEFRTQLGLLPHQPINPFLFAQWLKVPCIPHDEACDYGPEFECLKQGCWSATLIRGADAAIIVFNSSLASVRIWSSIVHEIAHFILGHRTDPLFSNFPLFQRNYTEAQEEEADCLSYILLLPRPMIENYARRRIQAQIIMEDTGLSLELVRYRISISGVRRQYKNWDPF